MNNIPQKIYLQVGEDCPDDVDFNNLSEVTWWKEKIFNSDLVYVLQTEVSGALPITELHGKKVDVKVKVKKHQPKIYPEGNNLSF